MFKYMAGAEGIEPSPKVLETPILPLNYAPKQKMYIRIDMYIKYGASCRTRTYDLTVNSRALYQLS